MKTRISIRSISRWLVALAALSHVSAATATILVKDAFPIATGAYAHDGAVYNTNPQHADIVGFSGGWTSVSSTSVLKSRDNGLAYPINIFNVASSGCLTIMNTTAGSTSSAGRMISRSVPGVPTSGTFFFSVLVKAEQTALEKLAANQAYGIGFSNTQKPSNTTSDKLPADGIFVGYAKGASGANGTLADLGLILRVNGANTVLLASPVPDETYFIVVRVEIGAGDAGAEIVGAVVNPDRAAVFTPEATTSVETELIDATSFSYVNVGGLYATGGAYVTFDELLLADTLQEAASVAGDDTPVFAGAPTVLLDGDQSDFVFTARLSNGAGDVYALVGDPDAYGSTNLVASAATTNAPVSATLSGLAANTCYRYAAFADGDGETAFQAGERTFFTGVVAVQAAADADEDGLVPGCFLVERPDTPDATRDDLLVDYALSGTAASDTNYVALPGSVVIPAGTNQVEVVVTPLIDGANLSATTLTLSVLPTVNYTNATSSATIAIGSIDLPPGKNVWVARADGNASDASNWSENRVPLATDDILLDHFSNAALTWDAGVNDLPTNVASWAQTAGYTNAVQIDTRRGGAFDMFVVTGDAVLDGGSWNHSYGGTAHNIGLRCTVGGNLTTGADFTFDGLGRGYKNQGGPSGAAGTSTGIAHGGEGGQGSSGSGTIYGDYRAPVWRGSSATYTSGGANGGGGAFYLVVGGTFTHNGRITVTGMPTASYPAHSGGSIFIQAGNLVGSGEFNAKAAPGSITNKRVGGGGGRIAIHLTDANVTFASFTNGFAGMVSAAGSVCHKFDSTANHYPGGCGTVYIETPGDNAKGVMLLDNAGIATDPVRDTMGAAVVRNGETWDFSRLILKDAGRIAIATNATLRLPSPDCIVSDGQAMNAIRFDDNGTLEFASLEDTALDARTYSVIAKGDSAYAGTIRLTSPRTLDVTGRFTVGGLRFDGVSVAPGTYNVADLAPHVTGSGEVVVLPSRATTVVIVR
ncbi:MAG: hypothetical protein ACOX9C_08225 [Kiritimatiellia bacterium]|jgi:hypothetical protein